MKVAIVSRKTAIQILILILVATSNAINLSCKSSGLPECNEEKDGIDQSHIGPSFCSLESWFQKISSPSFECNNEELDTFDGITILPIL